MAMRIPAAEWHLHSSKLLFISCHAATASAAEEPACTRLGPVLLWLLMLLMLRGCHWGSDTHIAVACTRSYSWKWLSRLWGLWQHTAAFASGGGKGITLTTRRCLAREDLDTMRTTIMIAVKSALLRPCRDICTANSAISGSNRSTAPAELEVQKDFSVRMMSTRPLQARPAPADMPDQQRCSDSQSLTYQGTTSQQYVPAHTQTASAPPDIATAGQ